MKDQNSERGYAVAAVIAAIPPAFSYFVVAVLSLLIIVSAALNWREVPAFLATFLFWVRNVLIVACILTVVRIAVWFYSTYHEILMRVYDRRLAKEKAKRQFLQNEVLVAKIELQRQLPLVLRYAMEQGHNVEYGDFKVSNYLSNIHMIQSGQQAMIEAPAGPLPTQVRYEDIRDQIPQGHVLVGIGPNNVVETKESAVGACVWIVGLSGTGKTSSTVLRVEERASEGHQFLAIDPHWFKPDSLANAVSGYADRFIRPPARDSKEALAVLNLFLNEFNGRKSGRIPQPWQPMTLLVDEVNALMDAQSDEEKEIKELLPSIARVCGQEARNFLMGGMFISQQATLLAWLRKVALMVIVHQLLMESEKKLALNGDTVAMEAMKTWPKGRTYVYGVGFQEGPRTVQQPYFSKSGTGHLWDYPEIEEPKDEPTTSDLDVVYEACQQIKERGTKVTVRGVAELVPFEKTKVAELMNALESQGCQVR